MAESLSCSQKTKMKMGNALKRLMKNTTFEKITVSDITNECNIHRQTFYYHFQDIYDLAEWACVEDGKRALQDKRTYDTWQEGLEQIFEVVLKNKPFITNVYHSVSKEKIENYLYKLTYELIIGVVEEKSKGTGLSEENKSFIADFHKYGFVGLMLDWIKDEMKQNPETLVNRFALVIQDDVSCALNRFRVDRGNSASNPAD